MNTHVHTFASGLAHYLCPSCLERTQEKDGPCFLCRNGLRLGPEHWAWWNERSSTVGVWARNKLYRDKVWRKKQRVS